MEAIRFTAKTKEIEIVSLEIPKTLAPNEVLIRVAYSGICGTDLHIIQVYSLYKLLYNPYLPFM